MIAFLCRRQIAQSLSVTVHNYGYSQDELQGGGDGVGGVHINCYRYVYELPAACRLLLSIVVYQWVIKCLRCAISKNDITCL